MLQNHPLFEVTKKEDRVGGMILDIETLDSTSWISKGDAVIRKSEIENVKIIRNSAGVSIKKSKIIDGSFVSTSLRTEWGLSIVESQIVSCNIILHDCSLSLNQMNLWNMDIVESEKILTNADIEEV